MRVGQHVPQTANTSGLVHRQRPSRGFDFVKKVHEGGFVTKLAALCGLLWIQWVGVGREGVVAARCRTSSQDAHPGRQFQQK